MKKIKFGWDYWNYSRQPEIREIIKKDFSGFSPDYTWQNDSDTLPLFDSNHQPTNAWHNIVPIFFTVFTKIKSYNSSKYHLFSKKL